MSRQSANEKDGVPAQLEEERADWLPHHERAMRAGRRNAELNAAADTRMERINNLLDQLGIISVKQMVEG